MRRTSISLILIAVLLSALVLSPYVRIVQAATVTHAVTTPDTGNTPNASGAFTPSSGDLLIVFVAVEASVSDPGNLTSSVGGFTFTQVRAQLYQSSAASLYCFVSNSLVTSATSQTVTTTPGDPGAGSNISVYRVAGMSRSGASAIRQSAGQSNQAASSTPAPVFGSAALTTNTCMGVVANATNPAGLTQPGSWTESQDTGYTTGQVNGIETAFRDSGETGTTITWGSTSASAFASIVIELDTSTPPPGGFRRSINGSRRVDRDRPRRMFNDPNENKGLRSTE